MTIDEAITHALEVAEQKEHDSITTTGDYELDIVIKKGCIQCAADHRQLAEWLRELKDLREENKVLTSECDRLNELKEKAVLDICRREARLKEAKRLLQLAWDDIQTLNDVTVDDEDNCLIEDKFESCTECPLFCESKRFCGWRYQVDALVLLGDEENGT